MGRVYTPKYRAAYMDQTGIWRSVSWNVRGRANVTGHGKPNAANAEKLRKAMNKSFDVGGVNFHASKAAGFIIHINKLRVIDQFSGEIVVEVSAPMFEVC